MEKKIKIIIAVLGIIAAVVIMVLLVPIEKKRQLYEKYGILAENAETDNKAKYILEHYDEYPDNVIKLYYRDNEMYDDFVYDYFEHKDDYSKMSFTDEELNCQEVPQLFMYDYRWAYEEFDGGLIRTNGCAAVSLTMANLYLKHNDSFDPVKVARLAEETNNIGLFGGISNENMIQLCNEMEINAIEYNYSSKSDNFGNADINVIKEALNSGKVVMMGMIGETFGNHAVIIRSCGENGELYINDPASEEKSQKPWDFYEIQHEIYFLWVLS